MKLPAFYPTLNSKQKREAREEYKIRQQNCCYFCQADLDGEPSSRVKDMKLNHKLFPPGFFMNPHHLHHSHKTGMTLGVVHARCNAVLWQYFGE